MKKTVLIAGGAGFIGSFLCDNFINEFNVICIDNFISGRKKNIEHLLDRNNFRLINLDVVNLNLSSFTNYCKQIDFIFHFASLANLPDILENPLETIMANSKGTLNLLKLAKYYNSKFILASTSEIYGDPDVHPQNEEYWGKVNPVGERSCYDESKRFAETLTMNFHRVYGMNTKIIRLFNCYGIRMKKDGRVIINLIDQALKGENLTIYGNGNQTRSFCYIDDLIDGIYKLAFSNYNLPINIGNPEEITINELARTIICKTNSNSKIEYKPLPQDDPMIRRPNILRAIKILDWNPKIKLDEGLDRTIEYYKKELFNEK